MPALINRNKEWLVSKLKENPTNGCLEWQSGTNDFGYGTFRMQVNGRSKLVRAHRFAWELEHGLIPNGLNVLHSCDNPPCCLVKHLFLGTIKDNNNDTRLKRRGFVFPIYKGDDHPCSRITSRDVLKIISLYKSRELKQREIGEIYGLTQAAISLIVRRINWKSVVI